MMKSAVIFGLLTLMTLQLSAQDKLEIVNNASTGQARNLALFKNEASGNQAINIVNFEVGTNDNSITKTSLETYHAQYNASPNVSGYTGLTNYSNGIYLRGLNQNSKIRFFIGGSALSNGRMTISDGGVGFGNDNPAAAIDVNNGAVFIRNTSQPILQDANGSCWELTVSTTGALSTSSVTCPQ